MDHTPMAGTMLMCAWLMTGVVGLAAMGQSKPTETDWQILAEKTGFEETARYDEVVSFCRKLEKASPWVKYATFGKSGELRDLPLLIVSKDGATSPQTAHGQGKLLMLVINGIHAGEIMGKDASLMLVRDIVVHKRHAELLDHVNLLVIPIFNVDGHERFGPYNRINQMGPKEMGWRVTSRNLNLNRDFLKADAVEMQAWIRLFVEWQPDLFFDNHSTDGEDCQYDVMFTASDGPEMDPDLLKWVNGSFYPTVAAAMEKDGHVTARYLSMRDRLDPSKGIESGGFSPRYSTGYGAIAHRPSILVETHVRKPYGVRVLATYDIMVHTLELLNRSPDDLRSAIHAAEQRTCEFGRSYDPDRRIPLTVKRTDRSEAMVFRGLKVTPFDSEISGSRIPRWSNEPVDTPTQHFCITEPDRSVAPPLAYLIPPQWTEAIDLARLHGLQVERLSQHVAAEFETYRFEDVNWAKQPFEGRLRVTFKTLPVKETMTFPAGSAVVRMNQPRGMVALHLFEPDAPDSLASWGFFNAIFEEKEYFEDYVMEPLARRMLENDPALKAEFEARIKSDLGFAANPHERLAFFYRRSPYWDTQKDLYPIARVTTELHLPVVAAPR